MSTAPLGYLWSAGARADAVTPLLWFTLALSIAVIAVIATLLIMALQRRRLSRTLQVERHPGGVRFITLGLVVTVPLLLATLGWTMVALAHVAAIPRRSDVEIDVTARQWWWQADYAAAPGAQGFATANEIHIPTGVKVLLRLRGSDVIHSFWVPRLSGKTDVIPGQVNLAWIEARAPGRYRGQCAEYCGLQHAHMAFDVVAEPPAQFAKWRQAQIQTAPPPLTPAQADGLALFEFRCGLCHQARGTRANSHYGPDLTHLMSRASRAAGTPPNTRASLAGWIMDPQGQKPGAKMPPQQLTGAQLQSLLAWLETLK